MTRFNSVLLLSDTKLKISKIIDLKKKAIAKTNILNKRHSYLQ